MVRSGAVPGVWVPAGHVLAVSQILSWLAKERRNVQEQIDRMRKIPVLIRALSRTAENND